MRQQLLAALAFAGALAFAADGRAQGVEDRQMKEGAIADLADYFQRAERTLQQPSPVPLILLMGPVRTYTSSRAPQISLCSVTVLSLDYSLPPLEGRPESHIERGRMLSHVELGTYYRVPNVADDCAARPPSILSTLWFGAPDGWHMDGMMEIIALGAGLIGAIRAEAPAYQGLDVRSFVEATPQSDIEALKREDAQRIGRFTWLQCAADEASFCESAKIRFGVTGPVTDLTLTVRSSRRPSERRTWIESARVQAGFGPIS